MKLSIKYKITFTLLIATTVVLLCTLPLFAIKKDEIYLYTQYKDLTSSQEGFVNELKRTGYQVKINSKQPPKKGTIGFWIGKPELIEKIQASEADYNFLYTEDNYYPYNWVDYKILPITLTPYKNLFEHYTRTNIKSAIFEIGINTADFYLKNKERNTSILYYGDNNNQSELANFLWHYTKVMFLGKFWIEDSRVIKGDNTPKFYNNILNDTLIVAINENHNNALVSKEIKEATLAGAVIITKDNDVIRNNYGDNVIYYHNTNEIPELINYYLKNKEILFNKSIKAQKITINKYSNISAVKRFKELLDWLKENSTPND